MKRQQCEEATEELEPTPLPEVSLSPPPELAGKMVKQLSYPALASLQPKEEPSLSLESSAAAMPARQPSLDPLCGLESLPLLYSSSGPRLTPPSLLRPALPIVRIIPDSQPEFQEPPPGHSHTSSTSFAPQHYQPQPASQYESESQYPDKKTAQVMSRLETGSPQTGPPAVTRYNFTRQQSQSDASSSPDPGFGRQNLSHHRLYEQGRLEAAPKHVGQFGHCPKVSFLEYKIQ